MMDHNTNSYFKDLPNDIDSIFLLVSEYSASKKDVLPQIQVFNNYLMLILREDIEINKCSCRPATYSAEIHPSLNCSNRCFNCLLLCALTAANAIFRYKYVKDKVKHSYHERDVNDDDIDDDNDANKNSRGANQDSQIICIEKWYKDISQLMVTNEIIKLMIKHLSSSCIFTSFQAKEVILTMIKGEFIAVHPILENISEKCISKSSSAYFNILKDLLSSKLFPQSVNTETFDHVQSSSFILTFLTTKFEEAQNKVINANELFEYFSLINKVVKFVMRKSDDFMKYCSYLCHLLQTSVLPYTSAIFIIPLQLKGHLVCSKYLKLVGELLSVVSTSAPQCVVDVSDVICPQLLSSFLTASSGGLLSANTFVSTDMPRAEPTTQSCISVLTKLVIEVCFKSCAISLRGNGDQKLLTANTLYSILLEVQQLISRNKGEKWLPCVFGDQDDKWIISLLCLLIIWKELYKWSQPLKHDNSHSTFVETEKLLKLICPHQFFFQFAQFISFDHLILADFLTSPETEFLNYFILYLHTVIDNWEHFYVTCSVNSDLEVPECKIAHQSDSPLENKKTCIEPEHIFTQKGEMFASENSNKTCDLKQNELSCMHNHVLENRDIFHKVNSDRVLVLYSDSESDGSNEDVCSSDHVAQGLELVVNMDRERQCLNQLPHSPVQKSVQVIEMFIRLRLTIERLQSKNLFPYNPKPLLKLLEKIENIFDSFSNKSAQVQ